VIHHTESELGPLPEIMATGFCAGHGKTDSTAAESLFHHAPFFFETLRSIQNQFKLQDANHHIESAKKSRALKTSLDRFHLKNFDDIADFDVVIVFQSDTTFISGVDFTNIVFEALE